MTMQPTYYVAHPDGSFSVAVPQPILATLAAAQGAQHPDDFAIDRFATAMKSMLAKEREHGPSRPWWNSEEASNLGLSNSLRNCVERGDPVGVANYCMLLHQRAEAILPATATLDDPKSAQGDPVGEIHSGISTSGGKWRSVELYRWPPGGARLYAGPVAQTVPDGMFLVTKDDATMRLLPLIARSLAEWHEDDGAVMWFAWCGHEWAGEPAWIGTPNDSGWPGYHTHWVPHTAFPDAPAAKDDDHGN